MRIIQMDWLVIDILNNNLNQHVVFYCNYLIQYEQENALQKQQENNNINIDRILI